MPDLIIPCAGGLDLMSDPTDAPAGTLRDCLNFEQTPQYGYSKRQGWSRYDGSFMGSELQDFYWIHTLTTTAGWVVPTYGELLTITLGSGSFQAICIGYKQTGTLVSVFFVCPSSVSLFSEFIAFSIVGSVSGLNQSGLASIIYQASIYDNTNNPRTQNSAITPIDFSQNVLSAIATQQVQSIQSMVTPFGTAAAISQGGSPPDAVFLLNDVTYCVLDCLVYNFQNGTVLASGTVPLEGHIVKQGSLNLGKILNVVVTSGNWVAGTAAGYIVTYDSANSAFTSLTTGNTLTLFSADGVTNLGNFAQYQTAGVGTLAVKPSTSRAIIYSTTDQKTGRTTANPGWTRVPLTREMPYTQAYPGQSTGVGFGPAGGVPFSVYEYSRQGLTTQIANLQPQVTGSGGVAGTIGCQNPNSPFAWVNINNIKVNDGAFATLNQAFGAGGNKAYYIQAQQFSFTDINGNAIPSNATVSGITVTVQEKTAAANEFKDYAVLLIGPDGTTTYPLKSVGKPNSANIANASTLYFYPPNITANAPCNDLWGRNWTFADLASPNFGVHVQYQVQSAAAANDLAVDYIGVQVTYYPPNRIVYIRNVLAPSPSDIPALIVHYTTDNNTSFTNNNATGTLTLVGTGTEAAFTAAGKSRVIGAGEQIRDAPGGAGNLLGWTAGTDYPVTLPPGASLDSNNSRWEWITYNFYSDPAAQMAFGCNGVEYGVGFDGTYLIRIRTGRRVDLDNPRHVLGYYGTLHLGYNSGDVLTSAAGPRPVTVSAAQLSQAYNVGQPVVGFADLQGQTVAVFCPRKVAGLQGTDPTNYSQVTLSPALGAFEYTVANVEGQVLWTSFRGVETMQTTNAYGNFDTIPLSASSTPWLQPRLQSDQRVGTQNRKPVYAVGVRNKMQYRLFFADGYTFTLSKFGSGQPCGMIGSYSLSVNFNYVARHLFQGIRSDGKEVIYACWDQQTGGSGSAFNFVSRLDCGSQDNGAGGCESFIEFNPVYPASQNKNIGPTMRCQYEWLRVFCQSITGVIPSTSTPALTVKAFATAGDDIPSLTGNYANVPTPTNSWTLNMAIQLSRLYMGANFSLPTVPSDTTIAAYGRMIRVRIDTNNATTGPFNVVKAVIKYDQSDEERS